ncbi:hypothetical protein DPMN_186919 [Dreissena polymorpha]|uniref:Uncharacterized protein n=1 Tax=Dreissena polymorpha TaxID=45954 RepID=A0A9D4I9U1_DREPO|nr:hypothetical protein DPMN_186919 [Dreissena polymorpha]
MGSFIVFFFEVSCAMDSRRALHFLATEGSQIFSVYLPIMNWKLYSQELTI